MNPDNYGGAMHSFTDSPGEGMSGTRQVQVQVLTLRHFLAVWPFSQ